MNAKPLIDNLLDNLRPAKGEKKLDRLGDVRAKTVVGTIANTLQEARTKKTDIGRHFSRVKRLNT